MSTKSWDRPRASNTRGAVLRLAARQHGVFHIDQAVAIGMSRTRVGRLIRLGEWERILPDVVAIPIARDPWMQRVSAACLWGRSNVAASHRTAGVLWELDGVEASGVEVTALGRKDSPREWLTIHETTWGFTIQRRKGVPVTSVARTLIDLAGALPRNRLERALEDAFRRRLISAARLSADMDAAAPRKGTGTLSQILGQYTASRRPTETEFERLLLRALENAGLPVPRCQYLVPIGGSTARIDFAYPEAKLAIEADSYRWHSGRAAWSKDRTRSNRLIGAGWRLLHATWDDVQRGAPDLIAAIRGILGQQELL